MLLTFYKILKKRFNDNDLCTTVIYLCVYSVELFPLNENLLNSLKRCFNKNKYMLIVQYPMQFIGLFGNINDTSSAFHYSKHY